MMNIAQVIDLADNKAKKEISKFGLPTMTHYLLSQKKGTNIAEKMGADVDIVKIGTSLMDFKLGEAFKLGRLKEHVKMSVGSAKELLSPVLDQTTLDKVLHCIEAHHGIVAFGSVEAEICANADCYRFIHPIGSLAYLATLGKREMSEADLIKQSRAKLEEKWSILSLEICQKELRPYYDALKNLLDGAESYLNYE